MGDPMRETVDALAEQQAELTGLLATCNDDDWRAPSPCEGWDVADVVLHLAQTNELAIASATGRFGEVMQGFADAVDGAVGSIDDAAEWRVAMDRGLSGAEIGLRWRTSVTELHDALLACDPHTRLTWVAGQLSARTLATTRLAETWIHTGDVAAALGIEQPATDRLRHIARLAWRTLAYAFERDGRAAPGPVIFDLVGPNGDRWLFEPDAAPLSAAAGGDAPTIIRGPALDLCLVAARRALPGATALVGEGPDAVAVLELVRTYA